jgi:hypothetical protein
MIPEGPVDSTERLKGFQPNVPLFLAVSSEAIRPVLFVFSSEEALTKLFEDFVDSIAPRLGSMKHTPMQSIESVSALIAAMERDGVCAKISTRSGGT